MSKIFFFATFCTNLCLFIIRIGSESNLWFRFFRKIGFQMSEFEFETFLFFFWSPPLPYLGLCPKFSCFLIMTPPLRLVDIRHSLAFAFKLYLSRQMAGLVVGWPDCDYKAVQPILLHRAFLKVYYSSPM